MPSRRVLTIEPERGRSFFRNAGWNDKFQSAFCALAVEGPSTMPITKYAQNAEECFHMAMGAKDHQEEVAWLGLAQSWLQLGRWGCRERSRGSSLADPRPKHEAGVPDFIPAQ
jgi:hypothetical protein